MRASLWLPALLGLVACHGKSSSTPPGGGGGGGDDSAQCEPGRCLDDISKVLAEHRAQSRACYDDAAKRTPGLAGRIIINFRIDEKGSVTEASQGMQDNQIQDQGLVTCVSDVIKGVTFGASKSGKTTRAYHQFEFGTNGDGGN
jgi:hypothetical protein